MLIEGENGYIKEQMKFPRLVSGDAKCNEAIGQLDLDPLLYKENLMVADPMDNESILDEIKKDLAAMMFYTMDYDGVSAYKVIYTPISDPSLVSITSISLMSRPSFSKRTYSVSQYIVTDQPRRLERY
jgi:hypothetical protein